MRIVVFESVCGGGWAGRALPPALLGEGEHMRDALLRDLLAGPAGSLAVLHDARLTAPDAHERLRILPVADAAGFSATWRQACKDADAVWPIAPETGGELERLCRAVQTLGKILLNSPAATVRIAASKHRTAAWLGRHGIPVVPTRLATARALDEGPWPCVLKPDDGAGAVGTRILSAPDEWRGAAPKDWVLQPFVAGESMSLAALFCRGEGRLLTINRQHIDVRDGRFYPHGLTVGAVPDTDGRIARLTAQIARALPGLWGFAGVDFVQTAHGPVVLEINPRLTLAWSGLAEALAANPATWVLQLARGLPLARLDIPARVRAVDVTA